MSSPEPPTYSAGAGGTMVIDHLHGRHAIPENIGPVRRLWMMTLLGDPPAASTTSTAATLAIQAREPKGGVIIALLVLLALSLLLLALPPLHSALHIISNSHSAAAAVGATQSVTSHFYFGVPS